jgi:predicted dehydrogenase
MNHPERSVRASLIGAGWWGAASHIPTLASRPDVVLDGVCRLGAEELERVKNHFGFAYASEDYHELLARRPDVVIVSSPHHLHYRHAADAIEAGAHVLCEKPLTLDPHEAWDLVGRARRRGVHLLVCNPYQYMPHVEELRGLLRSGEAVGTIESVFCSFVSVTRTVFSGDKGLEKWKTTFFRPDRSTWQDPAQGGGFAYGQLSHAIPFMLWLTGLEPRRVSARHVKEGEIDLCNAAAIAFQGGAVGALHGAAAMPENNRALMRLVVSGSEGVVIADVDRDWCEIRRHDGKNRTLGIEPGTWVPEGRRPTDALIDLAQGRGANSSPGEVGATAVSLIEAMLRAGRGADADVFAPASQAPAIAARP